MSLEAFAAPGRFHRGNLHTHSSRSDGALPPDEVCRRYAAEGYDFICVSDHFLERFGFPMTDTTAFRSETFTTLIGAEMHAPATSLGELWHILAIGLPLDFAVTRPDESGAELAARCLDAGAFVAIPHPEWYSLTTADAATIPGAHAMEVYNHTAAVQSARGGGSYFLDMLLNEGRRINVLAGDDAHFSIPGHQNRDAFGGWIMVKARENSPDALLEALKAGHFYATQGPKIEAMHRDGSDLVVECSPVDQISLLGKGARSELVSGKGRTGARLPLDRFAGSWCRLAIRDASGRNAWSNPMWL